MALDFARHVGAAGEKAGVELIGRLHLASDIGRAIQEPDLIARADCFAACECHSHRPIEIVERQGELALLRCENRYFAGLIGADQQ